MTDLVDILVPTERDGTETTVSVWHKLAGEDVQEGEPLLDLETDKVVVEVAAPASGRLAEILIEAGEEVHPGEVLGRIDTSAKGIKAEAAPIKEEPGKVADRKENAPAPTAAGQEVESRLSPPVRRLIEANNLNPADIAASGANGRLTLRDVEKHLESRSQSQAQSKSSPPSPAADASRIPHTSMRKRIAEHMAHSLATAPQVTAVFEADFTAILQHRSSHRESFTKKGINLTLSSYFIHASVQAMKEVPTVNSRWTEDYLEVFDDINFGIGTALEDGGLIVPVLKKAQLLSHEQIATQLHELTELARSGGLKPADVADGTFSMSNHGVSGSLIAAPIIIIQPQSAILGIGKLVKRAVVKTENGVDTVQIRPIAYVSLTIDHRVLDGQQTNRWLTRFVDVIENWAG